MRAHNDAVVAALEAEWPAGRVYRAGEVPGKPVTPYLVVSTDSGLPVNYRVCGDTKSFQFRAAVQIVGRVYDEAADAAGFADAALKGRVVTVAGRETTPCRREIATAIRRDPDGGGLLYGLHTYVFTSNPTE